MMIETLTWLYSLLALTFIVIIVVVRRCSKVRVWIKMHPRPEQPLTEIGYLDMNGDHTAGEVHLSGTGSKVPIGRVIVDGQSKKSIGSVELLVSDIEGSLQARQRQGKLAVDDKAGRLGSAVLLDLLDQVPERAAIALHEDHAGTAGLEAGQTQRARAGENIQNTRLD